MVEIASVPIGNTSHFFVGVHVRLVGLILGEIEGGGLAEVVECVDVFPIEDHAAVV